jgi:hypothetical protein
MYNKLFTKILDSSIWLEPDATRIIWFTLIAAMDEEGFAQFASIANLAHRARVSIEKAREAIENLESEDPNSSDPEFGGRRIERVPGGWIVLNAIKYRKLVTRQIIKEQTRERVAKYRRIHPACNAPVTQCNDSVTPSDTDTRKGKGKEQTQEKEKRKALSSKLDDIVLIFDYWREQLNHPRSHLSDDRKRLIRARLQEGYSVDRIKAAIRGIKKSAWHMGKDERNKGTKYDDITLICRNGSHVDKFADLDELKKESGFAHLPQLNSKEEG